MSARRSRRSASANRNQDKRENVSKRSSTHLREVAFYYPGHLWYDAGWIKTLLLFFDGVALLVPEYKRGEPEVFDPFLASPLREKGLLHYLIADKVVNKAATEQLVSALLKVIDSGALDVLSREGTAFHEISMSRMGFYGDQKFAKMLFKELESRGLARKSKDGVSIPLQPQVRYLILTLLAQILRPYGPLEGLDLSPATDQVRIVASLTELLKLPSAPSAGNVVVFDLQTVSVDLRSVPLDEVLDFRTEHKETHRRYARSVREFARLLSLMPEPERAAAFNDRQAELDDLASDLRQVARSAWRKPASFALGLAGATWSLVTGDPIGALIGAGSLALDRSGGGRREGGAFSYLFAAHESFA